MLCSLNTQFMSGLEASAIDFSVSALIVDNFVGLRLFTDAKAGENNPK